MAKRKKLPETRESITRRLGIGERAMTAVVGLYSDGKPAELFLYYDRPGDLERGYLDAFACAVSIGLQNGVPLSDYTSKMRGQRFGAGGFTGDVEFHSCTSMLDLLAQWLDARFGKSDCAVAA